MRTLKRLALLASGAGLVLGLTAALLPGPVPVEAAAVAAGPLRVTVLAAGRTRVKARFVVSAPAAGHLQRLGLRAGDPVTAGQPVAFLLPAAPALLDARVRAESRSRILAGRSAQAEAQANVERARVGVEQARAESDRTRLLAQAQAVSRQVVEQAEFQLLARERELALAERGADRASRELDALRAVLAGPATPTPGEGLALRSPAAGRVLRVLRDSEGPIASGTPVLEVGDPTELEVVLDLLTSQAVRVRPGAEAHLEQWGGTEALGARVAAVEPSGFTKVSALGVEEQRVNVLLAPLPGAGWPALGDGFHVEGRIVVSARERVLKAPAGALFRHGGVWAAFVLEAGHARLHLLETGESTGDEVEVLGGLQEGDRVVLHPSDKVTDGARVESLR